MLREHRQTVRQQEGANQWKSRQAAWLDPGPQESPGQDELRRPQWRPGTAPRFRRGQSGLRVGLGQSNRNVSGRFRWAVNHKITKLFPLVGFCRGGILTKFSGHSSAGNRNNLGALVILT